MTRKAWRVKKNERKTKWRERNLLEKKITGKEE
jgi:hypothetical protein